MKKTILFLAALSLSSQAFAMGSKVRNPSTTPVPAAESAALSAENQAFITCIYAATAPTNFLGKDPYVAMQVAFNNAMGAARFDVNNLADFNKYRDQYHARKAEMASFGC